MSEFSQLAPLAAAPEIFLAVGAMALLMFGVFIRRDSDGFGTAPGLLVLMVTAAIVFVAPSSSEAAFGGVFVVDDFARIAKIFALFGAATALLLSRHFMQAEKIARFEYPVLVLLATLGMLVMISANDLMALYMGLELQSLALYVIAAFDRTNRRSSEAGLKYFVLAALSSGLILYGCSLIYGFVGATGYTAIADTLAGTEPGIGLIFGLVFLLSGLAFKISAVPFHMWTPDVYEGAPTPVTAFLASAPKVAAMAVLARLLYTAFPAAVAQWQQIVALIAVASMVLGAFAAIGQTNIKRLLAYSSISHMGYGLVGLASASLEGVQGTLIYIAVYAIMTLGAFGCVLAMRRDGKALEDIRELSGLAVRNGKLAFALAALMFSLAGIPPLAGFFGKYYVFLAAIQAELIVVAVIGVVSSVIGAYYYLRIVKIMYFDPPAEEFVAPCGEVRLVVGLAGVFVVFFALVAYPLVTVAGTAAHALF